MKHDLDSLKAALQKAPTRLLKARLTRMVPQLDFGNPPNWLYTSGKPNRYNPKGTDCIYFSETRETAQAEYDAMWNGLPEADQPVTIFYADVHLNQVLDLTDSVTLKALGLKKDDLFESWRMSKAPTVTQRLGQAVVETGRFSGICYPSAADGKADDRANVVIFRDCVKKPDSVKILGKGTKPLQEWP